MRLQVWREVARDAPDACAGFDGAGWRRAVDPAAVLDGRAVSQQELRSWWMAGWVGAPAGTFAPLDAPAMDVRPGWPRF